MTCLPTREYSFGKDGIMGNLHYCLMSLRTSVGMLNLAHVRFVDGDAIRENFLFCKELPEKTTGEELFRAASEHLEQGWLTWENCISAYTDGAAAMVGRTKGFVSRVKERHPDVIVTYSLSFFFFFFAPGGTHCQDFTSRPGTCAGRVVRMINFVKARPLKSRIFASLWEKRGAEHKVLLLHTGPMVVAGMSVGPCVCCGRN